VSLISSFGSRSRRGIGAIVVAVFALAYSRQGAGQTPASPAPPLQTFRPPVIVLAEPASDATVPQDRPIVMFRFAAGDSADPIDARSFVVSVDGKDRTPLFEVVADVAFGPLAPPPNNAGGDRRRLTFVRSAHLLTPRVVWRSVGDGHRCLSGGRRVGAGPRECRPDAARFAVDADQETARSVER